MIVVVVVLGYFHVSVFYTGYFIKEIENVFPPVFPYVIETLVEVW